MSVMKTASAVIAASVITAFPDSAVSADGSAYGLPDEALQVAMLEEKQANLKQRKAEAKVAQPRQEKTAAAEKTGRVSKTFHIRQPGPPDPVQQPQK